MTHMHDLTLYTRLVLLLTTILHYTPQGYFIVYRYRIVISVIMDS